jgi:hypothetical protein
MKTDQLYFVEVKSIKLEVVTSAVSNEETIRSIAARGNIVSYMPLPRPENHKCYFDYRNGFKDYCCVVCGKSETKEKGLVPDHYE